jgi:hypothetical protein
VGFTCFYFHSENDRYIHTGSLSRVPNNILRFAHQSKMTNKQKKEKKLTFLNHLLAPTFFGTKSKEQEVNLVWPNLCIF